MYWCAIILTFLLIIYILQPKQSKLSPRTKYLFITGGYDSVFRLCQLVITERVPVQPIYLNLPDTDGYLIRKRGNRGKTGKKFIRRRNVDFEILSMRKAINELTNMGYGYLIYPIQIITECELSAPVIQAGNQFYKAGTFNRAVTQYIYMAEVSLQMNEIIETGVLCADGGSISKTIGNIIDPETKMLDMYKTRNKSELIFKNLRFPLCGLSKKQMLAIAKRDGYEHILHLTISCWYPSNDGKPCLKCTMCRERII